MCMIDIITVCFNSDIKLNRTLQSLEKQNKKVYNLTIIDGGSTDDTIFVIAKFKNIVNRFVSEKDFGIYDALNKGIRMTKSEIIGFIHADDEFSSNNILELIDKQFKSKDVDVLYGDLVYVNSRNKVIRSWKSGKFSRRKLKFGWMPPHPTVFMKRSVYEKHGYLI